jgi:hypothetical protein
LGFSAESAGLDHAAKKRWWQMVLLAELLMKRFRNCCHRIEANEVGQSKWTHRVRTAQAHRGIEPRLRKLD